ncbi:hypothetical protein B0H10DRAFT_603934 [Mycena sp. CBHHK59/15]|nr:hypothetical protein B0H10DRAFT_603934 [Mycena sp. CBHHK59/15]
MPPVHIDFANPPLYPVNKIKAVTQKVKKPVAAKAPKAVAFAKSTAKTVTPRAAPLKPTTVTKASSKTAAAKLVAESASDAESPSSEEESAKSNNSEDSDSHELDDVAPTINEFVAEVPRIVPKKVKSTKEESEEESDDQDGEDVEMTDIKQPWMVKPSVQQLFESDEDEDVSENSVALKAKKVNRSKPQSDSDEEFPEALGRALTNSDSEMDFHEHMAKAVSTVPRRSHSRRSSGASWSSGQDLLVPDSDMDNVLDDFLDNEDVEPIVPIAVQKKKARKVSAARQKQADLEKPEVRAAPVPPKKMLPGRQSQLGHMLAADALAVEDDPSTRPEDSWHVSARVVYPAPGKDVGLNSQSEELKSVLRGSIELVKTSILFEDAYPSIISRAGYARTILLQAAIALPAAIHVKHRLTTDLKYAAILADILIDRVNILRGGVKRVAVAVAPGFYLIAGLSPGKTKERVEELLKDHRYIFPVDPQTNRLQVEKPFHHPALRAVLKEAVFAGQFKMKNIHLFISTSKKRSGELELPDSMVALGGTALYATLLEYRLTGERQTINFTEGAYEETYRNHMKTLADTRAAAPVALHKVLHSLFNVVTDSKAAMPEAGSSATLINLVDLPESD